MATVPVPGTHVLDLVLQRTYLVHMYAAAERPGGGGWGTGAVAAPNGGGGGWGVAIVDEEATANINRIYNVDQVPLPFVVRV